MFMNNIKYLFLFFFLLELFICVGISNNIYFFFIFFLIVYIFSNSINFDNNYESKFNFNFIKNKIKFNIFTIFNITFLKHLISNYVSFTKITLFFLSYHIVYNFNYKYNIINKMSFFIN